MPQTRLRELLQQLHDELEDADSVGPEARELLKSAMDEIHGVLERTEDDEAEEGSIGERLSEAVVEFENEHPQLAFTIRRLVKSLADIGI